MKRNVCRIGSAAVCAALCLALGCSCSVLPPASGKPAAPASSVPTDKNGNPLYDSSRLDDGKLRILYGYDNSGGACTVLCGSKVLYQSFRSENVNLLQDTVTGETLVSLALLGVVRTRRHGAGDTQRDCDQRNGRQDDDHQ